MPNSQIKTMIIKAELAFNRFNDKSEESCTFINNATRELNELNSKIPYTVTETIYNFIEEPETDYSESKVKTNKCR